MPNYVVLKKGSKGNQQFAKSVPTLAQGKRLVKEMVKKVGGFAEVIGKGRKAMFKAGNPNTDAIMLKGWGYWDTTYYPRGGDFHRATHDIPCTIIEKVTLPKIGTEYKVKFIGDDGKQHSAYAPLRGVKLNNPDTTPSDPKEIAQDLRILKAKQKLVRLEGGARNPGGYKTLSIIPGPKGQNIFSLVAYTATKLPTGEMVWRDPKVITHKVTPDRATELIAHGYKGSYVHRGSLFNKRTNLLEHNPSVSYRKSLEGLSPLEKSNKIASDIIYLLKESYKQRGDATLQSDTKHFLSVWGDDLTTGDKNWIKYQVSTISGKRKNPSGLESSKKLFESFHGREPDGEDDVVSFEKIPDHLTQLGELREMTVIVPDGSEEVTISFPENPCTVLASAPGGTQYVLIGGDQSIDVSEFDIEETAEEQEWARKLVLGQVARLTYFTDKHHLEGPKYQKDGCLYEHELGEEGGELPTLVYDPNNESLEIVGGSYVTRAEGIRN